jgi:hypothetical protein
MILVAIAWMYVVSMMALAEATSSNGSLPGALATFVFYGALPLSIVIYLLLTPRRRGTNAGQTNASDAPSETPDPDGSDHAPGGSVTAEGKEP